jgi:hypothetical protein
MDIYCTGHTPGFWTWSSTKSMLCFGLWINERGFDDRGFHACDNNLINMAVSLCDVDS